MCKYSTSQVNFSRKYTKYMSHVKKIIKCISYMKDSIHVAYQYLVCIAINSYYMLYDLYDN